MGMDAPSQYPSWLLSSSSSITTVGRIIVGVESQFQMVHHYS
jgi:hypothetical protein